jgi:hypothetical protein
MRPRDRRETGEQDLFRSRLDQIIDMEHALVKLAQTIDWGFLAGSFGAVYKDGAGQARKQLSEQEEQGARRPGCVVEQCDVRGKRRDADGPQPPAILRRRARYPRQRNRRGSAGPRCRAIRQRQL